MSRHSTHSQSTPVAASAQSHNAQHTGCCGGAAPSHDAIAHRAFDIYVQHGRKQGQCKQNWHQAETELQTASPRA
jgi:hypothetical protein